MFRRIKKTTALLLAVMMLISVTPFSALASIIQPQVDTSGGVSLQSIYDGVGTRSIGDPETAKREYSFFDGDKLLSGAARPQTVKNDEYLSEPVLPAKENYIFIGWYDASEGGEKFDFSIPVTDIVYKDETANLYARYTPAVNLVFMDKSGRIFKIKQGAAGTEIPLGDVVFPVDQDETITGWSETPAGDDVQEKLPDPYTLSNKDKVIYPIIEKGYWLSFESKGGTYIEPVFCEGGQKPAQPEAPTRLGYDFAGWFMQNDTPFSFTDGALLTDGTTIYAKWNPQSAAVSYTEVYWIENDKGTGYLFEASATKWAQTDTLISDIGVNTSTDVINSDYREHFEYDSDAQNKTEAEYKSVTVKGDGSTTVNVYFTRKTYTLFFYDKSSFWSPKLVATISAKYNQSIKDEFPIENYEGRAWESTNTALYPYALQTLDRMPGANVEFNLYSKNSKIKKNIYYYTEELNGEYSLYKTVETFFKFITYDEEYHPIQGFDRETPENAGFERTYSGGWRKNFENNEVSLYYLRASYPLTFSNGGEIVRTDTYKFEADLTNAYNFIPEKPAGIPSAYEFRGWYTSEDGVEGTNAGRYPMELSEEQFIYNDPNFKDVKFNIEDGYLAINPFVQKLTVTITENSGTDKYDGTEKTVEGYTVKIDNELYTEADFTFSGDAAVKGTNAGTYNMELKPEDFTNTSENFTNVEFVIVDGTLEITKREVTLTSASDEKVYDGTALTNDTVTVGGDGFVEGEGATYDVTGSQLDVGGSKNTFTYKLNEGMLADNYDITMVEGTLTVTALTDKITVKITENSGTYQYDGEEKTVEGYTVKIDNELYTESDFTFSGDAAVKGTNAGTYNMELKPEDFTNTSENFTNVEFVVVDGMLEITKREVTLTSASDEKVYDGTPLTNDTVTVSGDGFAEGEGATYDVTGSQLDVGRSNNTFTYTLNEGTLKENYDITMVEGTLTVTALTDKITVTITENSGTYKYDGEEKMVEGYTVKIDNELYKEADFTFSGDAVVKGTNAGTYNMELKPEDFTNTSENFTNVEFVVVDGMLEITKREVTLTSASDEKVYDGTPLTNDTVTVSGDGFAEGEGATYYVTGKRLNVGASDNAFTYTLNDGTLESNYKIMMVEGLLKVTEMLSSHYSLFWMSDTKIAEQGLRADAYKDMISWVRNNADEHEAFALVTTGNIVNYANNDAAWKLAESEIKTLPEELRYYPTAGQSDVDGDELNFVPYVGHCESVSSPRHEFKEGHIWYQSQAGHRLVLMGIDYKKPAQTPKEEKQQKQWLSAVNDAAKYYKNYSIVLLVNGFMDEDGNLTEFGQLLDQQVLSRNANIRLVLCGNAEGTARWAKDYGTHTVNGLMFNYQNDEENGLGFLRVLTFNDENRSIEVYTYSPTMNRESYDAEHPELDKFTLFNAY